MQQHGANRNMLRWRRQAPERMRCLMLAYAPDATRHTDPPEPEPAGKSARRTYSNQNQRAAGAASAGAWMSVRYRKNACAKTVCHHKCRKATQPRRKPSHSAAAAAYRRGVAPHAAVITACSLYVVLPNQNSFANAGGLPPFMPRRRRRCVKPRRGGARPVQQRRFSRSASLVRRSPAQRCAPPLPGAETMRRRGMRA